MSDQPPLPEPLPGTPSFLDPLPPANDHMMRGCLMGCGIQVVLLVLAISIVSMFRGGNFAYLLVICIAVQWLVLVPLIRNERELGYRESPSGLIIVGCLFTLLVTTCAVMVLK
jgi:hypothetical protein